jgi:hypothetical protein
MELAYLKRILDTLVVPGLKVEVILVQQTSHDERLVVLGKAPLGQPVRYEATTARFEDEEDKTWVQR